MVQLTTKQTLRYRA